MPDYSKAKIYRLVSPSGLTYIGSTCCGLAKRKAQHKKDYKAGMFVSSRFLYKENEDAVEIVLIEDYPCENKEQLHKRERHWIENTKCVNIEVPTRTPKEWREQNKESVSANKKSYYLDNKDTILEKRKQEYKYKPEVKMQRSKSYRDLNADKLRNRRIEMVMCECGHEYSRCSLVKHRRTDIHKQRLEALKS